MPAGVASGTPFDEQLAFFKAKLNLPTERWDDIMRSAHDRAFVVAGVAKADLLEDLRSAVTRAIEQSASLQEFRKEFNGIVKKHGWTGWTGEGSKAGEAWRTRVIYTTNLSTSYAAGRWAQLNDPKLAAIRPYWKYIHADGVAHPRPLHVAWNGLVLHKDHEFWRTHFPPNGWGCHCRVTAVDARALEAAQRAGKTAPPEGWDKMDPKSGAPVGIDKGFDYAPGASAKRPLQQLVDEKLIKVSSPIGAALNAEMAPVIAAERAAAFREFVEVVQADPVARGRTAIAGAIERDIVSWLAREKLLEPASAEIAVSDSLLVGRGGALPSGGALAADDWMNLPAWLASPEQVLYDETTGKLLYIFPSRDATQRVVAEFEFLVKKEPGQRNMLVSAVNILQETIETGLQAGLFKKVR